MGSSDWAIHRFTKIVEMQAGEMNIKILILLAIVQTCVAGVMKENSNKRETNEDSQEKVPYSPAGPVLDRSPQPPILSTNTAQTLPSQIVFATDDNTNDQQQAIAEKDQDPSYLLLTPLRQTKPVTPESAPSALPGRVYNPQLLVQNPSTGLSVQTLPSPIQFAKTTTKRPYVPGQNKQQFTKPWPADADAPKYYLLRSVGQTKPFLPQVRASLPAPVAPSVVTNTGYNPQLLVNNPSTAISAQTLPSPIIFDQAQQEDHKATNFLLLNPVRQTRPFPAPFQTPRTFPQVVQYSREIPASGDFFPGVSTRPSYPPGYSPAAAVRTAQTQDIAGPKTVLYIL